MRCKKKFRATVPARETLRQRVIFGTRIQPTTVIEKVSRRLQNFLKKLNVTLIFGFRKFPNPANLCPQNESCQSV